MIRLAVLLSVLATACGGSHDTPTSSDPDASPDTAQTDVSTALTDDGPVHGTISNDLVIWKGIPYAQADRWMPPARPTAWTTALEASDFGPACPQANHDDLPQAEACLTVNVWAPSDRSTSHPVLVYIHGGGYVEGSARDPGYDGATLTHDTGAVVVTIQYRLGLLGYLAMTELQSPDGGIGNFGLRDQIFALGWVHRNIAAFGGDPSRVMLSGESAGGAAVCTIVGAPSAQGLFTAASIQSGPCRAVLDVHNPTGTFPATETFGTAIATQLGCTTNIATCLRGKTTAELLGVALPVYYDLGIAISATFPVVDGVTLVERPFAALQHLDAPLIIGSNREDGGAFTYMDGDTAGSFDAYVHAIGQDSHKAQLDAAYPVGTMGELGAIVALSTDLAFACNVALAAYLHHGPTYAYELDRGIPNGPLQFLHATHGWDYVDLFGTFTAWGATATADDLAVSTEIQHAWIGLANGQAPWTPTPGSFHQLDSPSTTGTEWRGNRCTTLANLGMLGN
ncbi:MAG: carboxylesterase family protein [Kofleriaceae bacterium]